MPRYLVTGGCGFIGRNLAAGADAVVLDDLFRRRGIETRFHLCWRRRAGTDVGPAGGGADRADL